MIKQPTSIEITYDKQGRMQYHPDYHAKHGTPWTTVDEKFLIDNYEAIGPEQISFALERTIHTITTRAYELRKKGVMKKPAKKLNHRRLHKESSVH